MQFYTVIPRLSSSLTVKHKIRVYCFRLTSKNRLTYEQSFFRSFFVLD